MSKEIRATNKVTTEKRLTIFFVITVYVAVAVAQYEQSPHHDSYQQNYGYQDYPNLLTRELRQSDIKNCTDINCGMEECCVETPRAKVCVPLTLIQGGPLNGTRVCARPKLCTQDTNCFVNGCCVYNTYVTSDVACQNEYDYGGNDKYNNYGYGYDYKQKRYPPNSYPGQIVKPRLGICRPLAATATTCILSITMNPACPCALPTDICIPLYAGSEVGICGPPPPPLGR